MTSLVEKLGPQTTVEFRFLLQSKLFLLAIVVILTADFILSAADLHFHVLHRLGKILIAAICIQIPRFILNIAPQTSAIIFSSRFEVVNIEVFNIFVAPLFLFLLTLGTLLIATQFSNEYGLDE